jgi:hypothetical protein
MQAMSSVSSNYSATAPYWLSKHVYVCRTPDHIVLLDLKRDEYLGIADTDSDAIAAFVKEWPSRAANQPFNAETSEQGATLIADLLAAGMLTDDAHDGKAVTLAAVEPPRLGLVDDYTPIPTTIAWRDVIHFTIAVVTTKRLLRIKSLEQAVLHVQKRHAGREAMQFRSLKIDELRARNLVAVFERLRPFLTTANDVCVFDSLALSEFLARYDLHPQWNFGVATRPFAAHCWLQHGDIIFNDTPDNIRRFTPIMSV